MQISTNWLKDYVDIGEDLKVLATKITKVGVNIEALTTKKINNLTIGYVESVVKHPDSDHLNICMVNIGKEIIQIVCGASNVKVGIKVIVAKEGTKLPGEFIIAKGLIRGIESNGMICALYELGLESKEENYHKGIAVLESDAIIGSDPMTYLKLDDTIYSLDLNPNRNDCLSHIGFAYEVAAVLGKKVTMPDIITKPVNDNINDFFNLKIDTDKCSMYQAKMVKDLVIKESPDFIKQRLISVGMRPINNVIDISNYVMLEYGQPLHFFDKNKIGNSIVVREAKDNEKTVTLDNKERELSNQDLVITNGNDIIAIAGVMGCINSNIDTNTKDILIESAIFKPYNVRYTSIKLDLRSEASLRFEKKLNYEYTSLAVERACHLLEKYASGKVLSGTVIYDNIDKTKQSILITKEYINKLLGMNLNDNDIMASFNALGFDVNYDNNQYNVVIPTRRMDIENNKADIVEEVGRLYGFENIKGVLPIGDTKTGNYIGIVKYRKLINKRLRSMGLNEVKTYTLVNEEEDTLLNPTKKESLKLQKPMSSDKNIIRQSLLSSMLKVVDYNFARGVKDVLIYEVGNTYYETEEETKIGIVMTGNYINNNWNKVNVKVDFYLLKGIVENIMNYLGFKNRFSLEPYNTSDMHPGMTAQILLDREAIGYFGRIHPRIRKEEIFVAEINMNKLFSKKTKPLKFKEVSKYPTIVKDVAFVLDKNIQSALVADEMQKIGGRLLTNIEVFDVYVGENVEQNKKSVAYSLTFSDYSKTLSDEEVTDIFNKIIDGVKIDFKAKIREK